MTSRPAAQTFVIETLACNPDRRATKTDAEERRLHDADHGFRPTGWTSLAFVRSEPFEELYVSHVGNVRPDGAPDHGPFGLIPRLPPLIVPSGLFVKTPAA